MSEQVITAETLKKLRKDELATRQPNRVMEDGLFRLLPWLDRKTISGVGPAYSLVADLLIAAETLPPPEAHDAVVTDLCQRVENLELAAEKDGTIRILPPLPPRKRETVTQ